uniref:Uncharacterized protein n=1 Tax=Arundo donax TaxID=35708 RepID=A0A0A9F799_ARUDO
MLPIWLIFFCYRARNILCYSILYVITALSLLTACLCIFKRTIAIEISRNYLNLNYVN